MKSISVSRSRRKRFARRIRAVSRDDVVELADALFASDAMTLTLLGDFDDEFSNQKSTIESLSSAHWASARVESVEEIRIQIKRVRPSPASLGSAVLI